MKLSPTHEQLAIIEAVKQGGDDYIDLLDCTYRTGLPRPQLIGDVQ